MAGRELIYFLLGVQLTPPPFFPVPTPPEPAYESPPTYGAGASVAPVLQRYVQTSCFPRSGHFAERVCSYRR